MFPESYGKTSESLKEREKYSPAVSSSPNKVSRVLPQLYGNYERNHSIS